MSVHSGHFLHAVLCFADLLRSRQANILLTIFFFFLLEVVYDGRSQRTTWDTYLEMEHSAANAKKSEWNLIVKCREKVRAIQETFSISHWANITEVFPDAEVKMLGKKVHLNLTEAMKNYEFAVFGKPGKNDRKRMQLGIFGSKPEKAQDWKIYVTLFDDTLMAFKVWRR